MTPEQITRAGQLVEAWEKPDRGGLDNVLAEGVADSFARRLKSALDTIAELQKSRELLERLDKRGGLGIDVHAEIRVVLGKLPA